MKDNLIKAMINDVNSCQEFAIGNDLVFIPEFELSFNSLFQKKVFSEREIAYCDQFDKPSLRYASTWAAKEAVYKSIKQVNRSPISFKAIEIERTKIAGIPQVILPEALSYLQISLSITHDGDYAWAIAITKK